MTDIPLEDLCVCDNCGHEADINDLNPRIPDFGERVDVGGTVPAAECPECGCLMYLAQNPKHESTADLLRKAADIIATNLDGQGHVVDDLREQAERLFRTKP